VLILAFDTATAVATSALLRDGETLGERASTAMRVLADAHELLREAGATATDLDRLVVGTGPGSFTGIRIGLAAARGLALGLGLPVAGVSTLDALAAGAPGALPVIDARRGEVFTLAGQHLRGTSEVPLRCEPRCLRPEALALAAGTTCVGDGAVRYRSLLEAAGSQVPPDESELHLPRARFHALLAETFGAAEGVEPLYLRLPDAEAKR